MKTEKELNELKKEVETLNKKLAVLNEEELEQVTGGLSPEDLLFPTPQLRTVENRLEHRIENLDNAQENIQTAESRIRDVNMAKEKRYNSEILYR